MKTISDSKSRAVLDIPPDGIVSQCFVFVNQSPSKPLLQLVAALFSRGHDVTLISGEYSSQDVPPGVSQIRLTPYNSRSILRRLFSWIVFSFRAAMCLAATPAEATVVAYSNPPFMPHVAVFMAGWRRFAVVIRILDVYPDVLGALRLCGLVGLWPLLAGLNRLAYPRCALLTTLAPRMASLVKKYSKSQRVEIIPEWISPCSDALSTASRAEHRSQFGLPVDALLVLLSGNPGLTHDPGVIAQSAILLESQPVHFAMCGNDIPYVSKRLKRCANVTILPRFADDLYRQLLATADIAIISLRAGSEQASFPSRLLGYLAAGTAVVAITNTPSDLADVVVDHSCGTVVPAGDHEQLAAVIGHAVLHPEWLADARANSFKAAESYSQIRWLPVFMNQLENIGGRHRLGRFKSIATPLKSERQS